MFRRTCPECGACITYTNRRNHRLADRANSVCRKCVAFRLRKMNGKIPTRWFASARRGARHRGIKWELVIQQVADLYESQKGLCRYSGVPITWDYEDMTVSIDRIDGAGWYHIDNVQLVHKRVNMLRGTLPEEEFLDWCNKIAARANGSSSP